MGPMTVDPLTTALMAGNAGVVLYCLGSLAHRGHQVRAPVKFRRLVPSTLRRHDQASPLSFPKQPQSPDKDADKE